MRCYFDDGCEVTIQTIGGCARSQALDLQNKGVPLIPVSIDTGESGGFKQLAILPQPIELADPSIPDGWCNFWRQDDWSATSYFYLDCPTGVHPAIAPVAERVAGLSIAEVSGG